MCVMDTPPLVTNVDRQVPGPGDLVAISGDAFAVGGAAGRPMVLVGDLYLATGAAITPRIVADQGAPAAGAATVREVGTL